MTYADRYHVWHNMLRRCTWPNHKDYPQYGGKGVTVCPEWHNYEQFCRDMGERPANTTLDRRDNTKGYNPENCRWATATEQAQNQGMYRTNKSGLKGLVAYPEKGKWMATRMVEKKRTMLYWGPDFFEACCAIKSWEARK